MRWSNNNCELQVLVQFAKIGTQKLTDVINKYTAGISIANGVPYEREPIRMLPSRALLLSILEASEQAFGT